VTASDAENHLKKRARPRRYSLGGTGHGQIFARCLVAANSPIFENPKPAIRHSRSTAKCSLAGRLRHFCPKPPGTPPLSAKRTLVVHPTSRKSLVFKPFFASGEQKNREKIQLRPRTLPLLPNVSRETSRSRALSQHAHETPSR
jgi:hypothetical protein